MAGAAAPSIDAPVHPATPWRGAVRVARAPLDREPSLDELVAMLAPLYRPFLLRGRWNDGAATATGGVLLAGAEPVAELAAGDDPFAALEALPPLAAAAPAGAVGGGVFGWLGFACAPLAERTAGPWPPAPPAPAPAGRADAQLAWYGELLQRDAAGQWWVEALLPERERDDALAPVVARWRARLDAAGAAPGGSLAELRTARPPATHRAAVAETVERIAAGELFQANVALQLRGALEGERAALVAPVLAATDPWYGAWIEGAGDRALLSASPELFLRRRGREVQSGPIKGTAPREAGDEDPAGPVAGALLASAKDGAEHVMIVDLMRNDLGRVCDYGSIHADAAPRAEPHAGVWHLVSTVRGRLHEGMGDARLLRATFPPGSVTGAPKVQAMRVIAAVEGEARGAFTGAHGFASPAAGLELAVTIRTLEFSGALATLGAGGGIVADSAPGAELREALRKAGGIAAAAGARVVSLAHDREGGVPAGTAWLRSADRRPDPRRGIFETLRVAGGHAPHAAAHLARLAGSLTALGLPPAPAGLAARIDAAAAEAGPEPQRLRVVLQPAGDGLAIELARLPFSAVPDPVPLAAVVVPGGLGPHKWLDRDLLSALTARLGATPLLVDADGALLEAAWANVWWLDGGVLCTPPLDGRLLPGVTREVVLAGAGAAGVRVAERGIRLGDLPAAGAALLLTSARGITPAALGDPGAGPLTAVRAIARRLAPLAAGD